MPRAGRRASVALPVVEHPDYGRCLVASRRSLINGHTGHPMSSPGQVVLFGGQREPGEDGARAAVRELCEEAGLTRRGRDPELVVHERVGQWTTESGHEVSGYLMSVPPWFVREAIADWREVSEVLFLPLTEVLGVPIDLEYHPIPPADRDDAEPGLVWFESPTLRVRDINGRVQVLWGLAGHMTAQLRHVLLTASDRPAPPG